MKQLLLLIAVALTVQANADNYRDMEPLKLETPEMKVELAPTASPAMELVTTADKWKPDFDFFKSKTNPGVSIATTTIPARTLRLLTTPSTLFIIV